MNVCVGQCHSEVERCMWKPSRRGSGWRAEQHRGTMLFTGLAVKPGVWNCKSSQGLNSPGETASFDCVPTVHHGESRHQSLRKIPTFSPRNNHYEAEMYTSSQLAASFHRCDTRSSVSRYSFLSPHLSLSSLHPSLHICRLCHTHFKRPWGVSVIPQCTSEKTWHAFRAQLPNASHYYHSSSTIIPWGKGATEPTQHLHTPPRVMDLWYPLAPYGAIVTYT